MPVGWDIFIDTEGTKGLETTLKSNLKIQLLALHLHDYMGHGTRTQPSQPFLSKEELIRDVVAQNLPNRRGSLLGPMPEMMPELSITQARRSDASRTRQKQKEPLNFARASLLFAQSGTESEQLETGSP